MKFSSAPFSFSLLKCPEASYGYVIIAVVLMNTKRTYSSVHSNPCTYSAFVKEDTITCPPDAYTEAGQAEHSTGALGACHFVARLTTLLLERYFSLKSYRILDRH